MLRSNSCTKFFFEKEKYDTASYNFKKLKYEKIFQVESEEKRKSRLKNNLIRTNRIILKEKEGSLKDSKERKDSGSKSLFDHKKTNIPNSSASSNSESNFSSHESFSTFHQLKFKDEPSKNSLNSLKIKKNYYDEFFYYIKVIFMYKIDLEKLFWEYAKQNKIEVDLHLAIIKKRIENLINYILNINKNEQLIKLLKEYLEIIDVIITLEPNKFYPDIKSIIHNKIKEISFYLLNLNVELQNSGDIELIEKCNSLPIMILVSISSLSIRAEFHSIVLNTLIDKMNRYFTRFIKDIQYHLKYLLEKDEKYFIPLAFIEKFLSIKAFYLKEFGYHRKVETQFKQADILQKYNFNNTNPNQLKSNFRSLLTKSSTNQRENSFIYDKFSSFSMFFFNNFYELIDSLNLNLNFEKSTINKYYIKKKKSSDKSVIKRDTEKKTSPSLNCFKQYSLLKGNLSKSIKITQIHKKIHSTKSIKLESIPKYFCNRKLTAWKSIFIEPNENSLRMIEEKCRICKSNFTLDKFVRHSYYCKERSVYINSYSKTTFNIGILVKHLQEAKSKLNSENNYKRSMTLSFTPKKEENIENILFSPNNIYKKMLINHLDKANEKNQTLLRSFNFNNCLDLFDCLLTFLSRRKNPEIYENNPSKLIYTNSLVHFLVSILCKKGNFEVIKNYLEIFLELFIDLMQEEFIIENLITLNSKFNTTSKIYKDKADEKIERKDSTKLSDVSKAKSYDSSVNLKSEISNFIKKFDTKFYVNYNDVSEKRKIFNSNITEMPLNVSKKNKFNSEPVKEVIKKSFIGPGVHDKENQSILSNQNYNKNEFGFLKNKNNTVKASLFNKQNPLRKESIKNISKGLKFADSFNHDNNSLKLFSQGQITQNIQKNLADLEKEDLQNKIVKTATSPPNRIIFVEKEKDEDKDKEMEKGKAIIKFINSNKDLNYNSSENFQTTEKSPIDIENKNKIHLKLFRENNTENYEKEKVFENQYLSRDTKNFKAIESDNKNYQWRYHKKPQRRKSFNKNKYPNLSSSLRRRSYSTMKINEIHNSKDSNFNPVINVIRNRKIADESILNPFSDSYLDENEEKDSRDAQNLEEKSQISELIELIDDMQNTTENENLKTQFTAKKITIDDFKILSFIGKGGYGQVYLGKKKDTGDIFAIKQVNLSKIEKQNLNRMLKRESEILNEINHDFLVKCYYIFADKLNYYYVMEYLAGGDLSNLMEDVKIIPHDIIKLIAAEVILALEYLHFKGIIHKDIKPENVLIANNGHFKLADFGLSEISFKQNKFAVSILDTSIVEEKSEKSELLDLKSKSEIIDDIDDGYEIGCDEKNSPDIKKNNSDKANRKLSSIDLSVSSIISARPNDNQENNANKSVSMIVQHTKNLSNQKVIKVNIPGTPNYTAPEIIKGKTTTGAVDLWSLGVILYELFTGRQPFIGENREKIYENILNLNVDWDMLKKCVRGDDDAYRFVNSLLVLDPNKRLHEYEAIKIHSYFDNINWHEINLTDNRYLKGYVQKKIKTLKARKNQTEIKVDIKELDTSFDNNQKNTGNTFLTERVDNLHIINMKEWKKKVNLDVELYNVIEYFQDFL